MSPVATEVKTLNEAAARAFEEGGVSVFIGYGRSSDDEPAVPVFLRKADEADKLVFDGTCFSNLAVYLAKPEIKAMGKVGLVVKGCDRRAVNVLLREHVVERDNLFLIGVRCAGVGDPQLGKCGQCDVHDPPDCDVVVDDAVDSPSGDASETYAAAAEIESMSLEDRWDFWKGHMEKCIRCYACRQACPMCYCKRCIVDKTEPEWVESSATIRGNLAWNVARALHLTGRCVGCGECERVCPMGVPLGTINQKIGKLVEQWYEYKAGYSPDEDGPFSTWTPEDPEIGIL
ncbi:4Fe-4S binding protein [Candidatus Hydrogenedentota bacterium]